MASGGDEPNNSSWWGNFIKSAKEKSISAFEVIKTDFTEFTTTMSNDTTNLLNQATTHLIENTSSENTSSLFKNLTKTISENFNFSLNDESTTSNKTTEQNEISSIPTTSIHDRFKQDLIKLQNTEKTFLTDPNVDQAIFNEWIDNFNPDNYKSAISALLIENSSMRLLYSQLVPAQISNIQFWSRYFFKFNQLEEEHQKRVKLIEKATIINSNKDETFDWDDDNFESNSNEKSAQENDVKNEEAVNNNNKTEDVTVNNQPNEPQTIQDTEQSNKQIETELKTEESDEWEKVSDVLANENEKLDIKKSQELEKSDNENLNKEINQETTSQESVEEEIKDLSKIRENVLSKIEKIEEKSPNLDAEWDDWAE